MEDSMQPQNTLPPLVSPLYINVQYSAEFKDVVIRANHSMWRHLAELSQYLSKSNSIGYHYHIDDPSVDLFEGNVSHLILEYNEPPAVLRADLERESEDGSVMMWNPYVDVRYHIEFKEIVIRANHAGWEEISDISQTLTTSEFAGQHYHIDDLLISIFGGNASELILEYNEPPNEE
jgi:hypothetical protein